MLDMSAFKNRIILSEDVWGSKNVSIGACGVEDPNLTEEDVSNIRAYLSLRKKKETVPSEFNNSVNKYRALQYGDETVGVLGRKSLGTAYYELGIYDIYDIFDYNGSKYMYALSKGVPCNEQQKVNFFLVKNEENFSLYFNSESFIVDVRKNVEYAQFFSWYSTSRRGFGVLPDAIYPTYIETMIASLRKMGQSQISQMPAMNLPGIAELEEMRDANKDVLSNLLAKNIITGVYNGIGVVISDGGCFGNSFQGHFAGREIKTPVKGHVIMDVVPLQVKNSYLALTYPFKKELFKKNTKLLATPVFFLITKDENGGRLSFAKISDDRLDYFCKPYLERFALIYMQCKIYMPSVFE